MSWNDYITTKLLNVTDANNHVIVNAVEQAAIIGNQDGAIWAATQGFVIGTEKVEVEGKGTIEMNEFLNIADAFAHNGDCTKDGGIRLSGVKYFIIIKLQNLKRKKPRAPIIIDIISNKKYLTSFNAVK